MRIGRSRAGLRAAALATGLLLLLPSFGAAQCAMCGTVGQGKQDPLVKGMFASIIFMVAMPFAVVGTLGGWIWTQRRRDETLAGADGQVEQPNENGDRS